MKDRFDHYADAIAFIFSGWQIITGVFFILYAQQLWNSAEVYRSMAKVMPFEFYGIAFCLSGVLLFIGLVVESDNQFAYYMAGGLLGTGLMLIYAAAGFENGLDSVTSWRYMYNAAWFITILVLGGISWRRRKRESKARDQEPT